MAIATTTTQTIQANKDMERYLETARDAGCPRDQFENFVSSGYVAIDGMLPFHAAARDADKQNGPEIVAAGGKRGPGKSHAALAQVGLDDCQRFDGLKFLFLRKIQKSATESLEDLVLHVFLYTPHQFSSNRVSFPNGSRIVVGGYKDEKDIEKYLGLEYDGIVIEEVTQISELRFDKLRGSLRTSKPEWRPRMYLNTNADGIGLQWFKKRIIEPQRNHTEHQTRTRFFDVTSIHNPFINPEYHDWLDSLKGSLRKAWRDGDWDAFAGMAFPMWDYSRHVISPFDIPDHWPKWRAIDWGSANPFSCHWYARNPDTRRIYVYREAYEAGLTTTRQAQRINDMTLPNEKILFTFADPAMWAKQNRKNEYYSAANEYRDEGIILTRADNDRINGKRKVDAALSDLPDGLPGLQIFSTCTNMIEQLSALPRDQKNPEDVDTDAEDHAYDDLRYALTNEKKVEKKPPDQRAQNDNPMNRYFGGRR